MEEVEQERVRSATEIHDRGQMRPEDTFTMAIVSVFLVVSLFVFFTYKLSLIVWIGLLFLVLFGWGFYREYSEDRRRQRRKSI